MDNNTVRSSIAEDEQTIDLKELFLYICRKWRVLMALGIVGLVLGAGVGLLKSGVSMEELDLSKINVREVEQYARYKQLYDDQMAYEKESVYLNIDPYAAYSGGVRYYLHIKESNSAIAKQLYANILREDSIYSQVIEESGLNCSERAIKELVGIGYRELDRQDRQMFVGDQVVDPMLTAEVTVYSIAPNLEACQNMLKLLDSCVQDVNQYAQKEYGAIVEERLEQDCRQQGYSSEIINARQKSTVMLGEYADELSKKKKVLTDDDLLYYDEMYLNGSAENSSLSWIKWALVVGVLFGAFGVCAYGVRFLLNDCVKSVDELLTHGLHPFAVLEERQKGRRLNALDRLFSVKYKYNSEEYLANALAALDKQQIALCGDLEDADVQALAQETVRLNSELILCAKMAVSADAQQQIKRSDGVVLLVHLWKTRHAELEQEIRICQKLGAHVLGVAIIA